VHHAHSDIPYEDGQDNKSQCQINREIRWDSLFTGTGRIQTMRYPYNSILVKDRWDPLQGMTLEADFFPEILVKDDEAPRSEHELSRAFFRKDTDMLTLPLTILFALEKLNAGDDTWTKKNVLTIHVGV
jgi:splicing suppressor protein 51